MLRDPHQQPLERSPLPPGTPKRLILIEEQAAEFLNMPRPKFREMASKGTIPPLSYGLRSYRYYVYDLLDWALSQRDG